MQETIELKKAKAEADWHKLDAKIAVVNIRKLLVESEDKGAILNLIRHSLVWKKTCKRYSFIVAERLGDKVN
jgi:hypothetical protein